MACTGCDVNIQFSRIAHRLRHEADNESAAQLADNLAQEFPCLLCPAPQCILRKEQYVNRYGGLTNDCWRHYTTKAST